MPSFVRRKSNFVGGFDVADPAENGRVVMLLSVVMAHVSDVLLPCTVGVQIYFSTETIQFSKICRHLYMGSKFSISYCQYI